MTGNLLDVNFLVALVWRNHVQHKAARAWLSAHKEEAFVTCTLTESSLVRLSMNPAVVGDVTDYSGACSVLEQLQNHPAHIFWPMKDDFLSLTRGMMVSGYRQITDACLLGLARAENGRLVTFDKKMEVLLLRDPRLGKHIVIVEP